MSKRRPTPMAMVLPDDARTALVRAAQTVIPKSDPLARLKAIEQATVRAKFQYPQYFKHKEF